MDLIYTAINRRGEELENEDLKLRWMRNGSGLGGLKEINVPWIDQV